MEFRYSSVDMYGLSKFYLGDWVLSETIVTPQIFLGNLEILFRKRESFLRTYLVSTIYFYSKKSIKAMSKGRASNAIRFEVEKFDGKINFSLWQIQVNDVLI